MKWNNTNTFFIVILMEWVEATDEDWGFSRTSFYLSYLMKFCYRLKKIVILHAYAIGVIVMVNLKNYS